MITKFSILGGIGLIVVPAVLSAMLVVEDPTAVYGGSMLLAAAEGRYEEVTRCLAFGVDPNYQDGDGNTVLHWVANDGSYAMVKQLLRTNHVDPNIANKDGFTPLMLAAFEGRLGVVNLLCAYEDIEINKVNKEILDATALDWAALEGHRGVFDTLKADGAVGNLRNARGEQLFLEPRPKTPDPFDPEAPALLLGRPRLGTLKKVSNKPSNKSVYNGCCIVQ